MYCGDDYDHGFSDEDWGAIKQSCRDTLVKTAKARETIFYSDLTDKIFRATNKKMEHNNQPFFHLLGVTGKEAYEKDKCILTAVVVGKVDGHPGKGFGELARFLGKEFTDEHEFWKTELNRVHEHYSQ